jgi:hypothetical protein
MIQESLLPGTDAITRGTVEIQPYRDKWLVRYKRLDGHTFQKQCDLIEAFEIFLRYVEELRSAARAWAEAAQNH